jgi:hypothetical protein
MRLLFQQFFRTPHELLNVLYILLYGKLAVKVSDSAPVAIIDPVSTIGEMGDAARLADKTAMNQLLLTLPAKRAHTACVDARDLKTNIGDNVHFDTAAQTEIGRRFAAKLNELRAKKTARDEAFAKAEKSEGVEKAKALVAALDVQRVDARVFVRDRLARRRRLTRRIHPHARVAPCDTQEAPVVHAVEQLRALARAAAEPVARARARRGRRRAGTSSSRSRSARRALR